MDRGFTSAVLLSLFVLAGCTERQGKGTDSSGPAKADTAKIGPGPAADQGVSQVASTSVPSGHIGVDVTKVEKEYAVLTGSSIASSSNVIFYPSLNEYSNCGESIMHALQPDQTIRLTKTPCGDPPSHYMIMVIREDSLGFLLNSRKADTVNGKVTFHFDRGQQLILRPVTSRQEQLIRVHVQRVQAMPR